jgi:hypothetical protein
MEDLPLLHVRTVSEGKWYDSQNGRHAPSLAHQQEAGLAITRFAVGHSAGVVARLQVTWWDGLGVG